MIRILFLTCFLLFLSMPVQAIDRTVGDSMGFIWGVTKDDIKSFETFGMFKDENNVLSYFAEINNYEAMVYYEFMDSGLWRTLIDIREEFYRPDDLVDAYVTLDQEIRKQYGEPVEIQQNWVNDRYKQQPDNWDLAVLNGHLSLKTYWQNGRTDVELSLSVREFIPKFTVEYVSRRALLKLEQSQAQPIAPTISSESPLDTP